jgi:hypothetical protein
LLELCAVVKALSMTGAAAMSQREREPMVGEVKRKQDLMTKGTDRDDLADLKAQRACLFAEVKRLKQERNEAIALAAEVQREVIELRVKSDPARHPAPLPGMEDVHTRIRSILDVYPAPTWNLAQSERVLTALVTADVLDLAARRACSSPEARPDGTG